MPRRAGVPIRLGWTAFVFCLVTLGCGVSPDAATTTGGEQVAQTKQADTTVQWGSLYILDLCVDVPGWNDTNGTDVQIYDCHGTTNQQWWLYGDGTVRPDFDKTKCLDLPGYETANGTPIQIYDCHGSTNQQWTLGADGTLRGLGNKCVDDPAFSTTDGTNLQYYDCNGGANQQFILAPPIATAHRFWNLKAEEVNSGNEQAICLGLSGPTDEYPLVATDCNADGSPPPIGYRQVDQIWQPMASTAPPVTVNGVAEHWVQLQNADVDSSAYSLCAFYSEGGTALTGTNLGIEPCNPLDSYQLFMYQYVRSDPLGYPCFTIQSEVSGGYIGVDTATPISSCCAAPSPTGAILVAGARTPSDATASDPTAGDEQLWCDHSVQTESFSLTPYYVVTTVNYAPPGSSSNMQYSTMTSVGSSISSTQSFQNSTDVSASVSVGPMAVSSLAGDSATVSANYTFGTSDTHEVDLTTTWTQGTKFYGETDGIDHDFDEIWLIVSPVLSMWFTPGTAGTPDTTNWQFSLGNGTNENIIWYVYAGELDGDMAMDAQTLEVFAAAGITSDMYPDMLQADAFFQGVAPTPGMDSDRFIWIDQFPYQPPGAPLKSGQMPLTQPYSVTQSATTSDTNVSSHSDSVGFSVKGGGTSGIFTADLTVSSKWTWSYSSSNKESSTTGSMDTLTVGQPSYGYSGPGLLNVYEDRIFKTYAFTLNYPGNIPFTDDGANGSAYYCNVGGVGMHCCPLGTAMIGVRLDQNVFKCAPLQDPSGVIQADTSTYRNVNGPPNGDGTFTTYNMHTCPFGFVMVGLDETDNVLACQKIPANTVSDAITGEIVDTGTQDGYPMHVCESAPLSYAMSGLDPANNLLTCATNPGLWPNVGLQILSATYGGDCGAPSGNETATLGAACRGLPSCTYVVETSTLGDPAPGCAKDYAVTYTCNGGPATSAYLPAEAGNGSVLNLQCP